MLRHARFRETAVVINEFGEIGLDHLLVAWRATTCVLLEAAACAAPSAAISCTRRCADLHQRRAAGDIPPFRRVIVETTGLADPAPLLNTLLGHRLVTDHYRLEQPW